MSNLLAFLDNDFPEDDQDIDDTLADEDDLCDFFFPFLTVTMTLCIFYR